MNKKALTLVFVTMLLFSVLIGVQFINKAKAETLGPLEEWLGEHPSGNLIKIITPQNTTYDSSSILLNFTVESNNYIYDVGYSLDGGDIERVNNLTKISEEPAPNLYLPPSVRVTYLGNLLLSNLSKGNHSITVYQGFQYQGINKRFAVFTYGTAFFTIDNVQEPKPMEPFPTLFVATVSVSAIALVGACLIIYFKKRKH